MLAASYIFYEFSLISKNGNNSGAYHIFVLRIDQPNQYLLN